ncbi:MAG: hypothetical protein EXR86_03770 [Gammaproteobacteria bacterium]|nr:hypothetical protein [Gammaproteobacteria bacterium]
MRHHASTSTYSGFEQRWFAAVLLYTVAPIAVVLVYPPRAVDFWWDFAMAIGATAAGGLALLPLISARWWAAQQPTTGFLRLVQTAHRELAYIALALVLIHAGILLVLEGRVVEYLKLGAEDEMLAGLVAAVLVITLVLSSRYREWLRFSYRGWRRWHVLLSLAALGLLGWHLIGAGYYFTVPSQTIGLVWLLGVPSMLTLLLRHWPTRPHHRIAPITFPPWRARRLVCAVSLIWLASALWSAWLGSAQSPLEERALCAVDPCL